MSYYNSSGHRYSQRGGGDFSGNYKNRNVHDNSGGHSRQRDNNYGRRDRFSHRPYHSHVGSQSGDTIGADWNTPLPSNAHLER